VRSFRFLLSRRWALFAIVVVILVCATWWLGKWQFSRLHERRASNEIVRTNEHAAPAPVRDVLAVGKDVDSDHEWRRVTATGTYDTADTIIWRYRSDSHDRNGVEVVVPLVTSDGTALLVDRGWMSTPDQDRLVPPPAPPSGRVTITGWVRANGTGSATKIAPFGNLLGTRALSSVTAGAVIDHPVFGGFVDLEKENGTPAKGLEQTELPELDDGPHFFYGIQWWFFGALAISGFFYLMYDERRSTQRAEEAIESGQATAAAGSGAAPQTTQTTATAHATTDATTAPAPAATGPETATRTDRPDPRALVRAERKAKRSARNAHKQAVRAAYQAAYERERAARQAQSERSMPPSTGTMAPETYDEAGESRNAATEPNSAGRP